MRNFIDIVLNESRSMPCIVVDVQPEYSGINDGEENFIFLDIIKFVNNQTGPVLMYCNAEQEGMSGDTIDGIKLYWEQSGFDENNWERVKIIDKGYGYLRSWMDMNVPDNIIIKTIRLMFQNNVHDSRELFGGENSDTYEEGFKNLMGFSYNEYCLSDPLITNWINIAQLKKFDGAYIMGGGRDECLREVELIMNAFNIKYKRIDNLIYG